MKHRNVRWIYQFLSYVQVSIRPTFEVVYASQILFILMFYNWYLEALDVIQIRAHAHDRTQTCNYVTSNNMCVYLGPSVHYILCSIELTLQPHKCRLWPRHLINLFMLLSFWMNRCNPVCSVIGLISLTARPQAVNCGNAVMEPVNWSCLPVYLSDACRVSWFNCGSVIYHEVMSAILNNETLLSLLSPNGTLCSNYRHTWLRHFDVIQQSIRYFLFHET